MIGNNCKIQNNVSIYTGAISGGRRVLRTVLRVHQRQQSAFADSAAPSVSRRHSSGAAPSIGANATIVCGTTVGRYAFIAAGAVVRGDVPDYALMMGVPARRRGWMSRHGHRMTEPNAAGEFDLPGEQVAVQGSRSRDVLRCLDWDEDTALAK